MAPGTEPPTTPRTESTDLAIGSFSRHGPWTVDPDAMAWRYGIDRLRAYNRAQIPRLLQPRRLPPLGRLVRIVSEIGLVLARWYLGERRGGRDASRAGLSRRLRVVFERLGSTFVKLGQIISSGEGLFPPELVREFRLLRDRVAPESFDAIREVVERDLGAPLDEIFTSFDETPIAAASIAQVHAARLRSGEDVVVKVQRPSVERLVREDIEVLAWLAPRFVGRIPVAALANPPALVDLFTETIVEELDFRLEAENMLDVARVLADTEQRAIIVPRPHPELVTRRVLVMERLSGFRFDDVESMQDAGVDTEAIVRAGLIAFMEGALLYGVFHGDLHGGNLFVRPDGSTVLLDFGITGRLDNRKRLAFLRLLVTGTSGDLRGQVQGLVDLGAFPPDTDVDSVIRDLELDRPAKDPTKMSAEELTSELRELTKKLLGYGARVPKELMLFVKNMVFLDGATATLAPDLDILEEIQQVYLYFAQTHGERILRELGMDPSQAMELDLDAVKNSLGLSTDVERLSYKDLRSRRELIQRRLSGKDLA